MITVYGMPTCPDCAMVERQIEGNPNYRFVDIGAHVMNLKAFLRIRDNDPSFEVVKERGMAGIPCFVLEDGTVTRNPEEAGLGDKPVEVKKPVETEQAAEAAPVCNIDGSGC